MEKQKTVPLGDSELKIINQALYEIQQDLIDEPNSDNGHILAIVGSIRKKLKKYINGN